MSATAGDGDLEAGNRQDATSQPAKASYRERYASIRPFVIISSSYILYTTTDGAIRMIVLLYAYQLGFTAMEVAIMFTLYEIAGVFTNLLAGLMGAKWGIKTTLLCGLHLQLFGIGMLYGWQNDWSKLRAIIYVTVSQMLCGIAKDLTKLGGKTVTKLVTPEGKETSLFRLVSLITGFKNSFKGIGYFLGAALVSWSLNGALSVMMGLILLAMPWAILGLSNQLGRTAKENATLRAVFKMNYNVNWLSAARLFLFGSRDAWFEVPLPFFLRNSLVGLGWSRANTGLFLGGFIIVYGQMQSWTPHFVLQPLGQSPPNKYVALLWVSILTACPAILAAFCLGSDIFQDHHVGGMTVVLVCALAAFCVLFAINSSVHSYLIMRYAEGNKVATSVGFYYMSNAMGRLTGTVASGALYSYVGASEVDGFGACFVLATIFCVVCAFLSTIIRDDIAGLQCGRCFLVAASPAVGQSCEEMDPGEATKSADEKCAPEPCDSQPLPHLAIECESSPDVQGDASAVVWNAEDVRVAQEPRDTGRDTTDDCSAMSRNGEAGPQPESALLHPMKHESGADANGRSASPRVLAAQEGVEAATDVQGGGQCQTDRAKSVEDLIAEEDSLLGPGGLPPDTAKVPGH